MYTCRPHLYYYGLEAVKGVLLLQTSWLHFRHQEKKRNTRNRTFISKVKTQKSSSCVCLELFHISWEKAMAPHSSTFAWKIPWTEKPGRLQSMGSLESDTTEQLPFHFSLSCIGEGNGNSLQSSCLENPMDGVAW